MPNPNVQNRVASPSQPPNAQAQNPMPPPSTRENPFLEAMKQRRESQASATPARKDKEETKLSEEQLDQERMKIQAQFQTMNVARRQGPPKEDKKSWTWQPPYTGVII